METGDNGLGQDGLRLDSRMKENREEQEIVKSPLKPDWREVKRKKKYISPVNRKWKTMKNIIARSEHGVSIV